MGGSWPPGPVATFVFIFNGREASQAGTELQAMLQDEALSHVPVLVLATTDGPSDGSDSAGSCASLEEIRSGLGLDDMMSGSERATELFVVSTRGSGWHDALHWMRSRVC